MIDIVPAILSYSKHDLNTKVEAVHKVAPCIHIDIMDGQFVRNTTVGMDEILKINYQGQIEYHLMVSDPLAAINWLPGGTKSIFQVHKEAVHGRMDEIEAAVAAKGSRLAVAINPQTGVGGIAEDLPTLAHVLVMAVKPGIDGQAYMGEIEGKISELRAIAPSLTIEVDGGINSITARGAVKAGANRLAAATAIFGSADPAEAYRNLYFSANGIH